MSDNKEKHFLQFFPSPEQGNMFGWKFSIISLILILSMAALTWYSYKQGNDPFKLEDRNTPTQIDTSKSENR